MRPGLMRSTLLAAHRWVGLVLAAFLVLAGLTGSLMVWVEELDALASRGLFEAAAPGQTALVGHGMRRLDNLDVPQLTALAVLDHDAACGDSLME